MTAPSPTILAQRATTRAVELKRILELLDACNGNLRRAAKVLGYSTDTLVRRLRAGGHTAESLRERWSLTGRRSARWEQDVPDHWRAHVRDGLVLAAWPQVSGGWRWVVFDPAIDPDKEIHSGPADDLGEAQRSAEKAAREEGERRARKRRGYG